MIDSRESSLHPATVLVSNHCLVSQWTKSVTAKVLDHTVLVSTGNVTERRRIGSHSPFMPVRKEKEGSDMCFASSPVKDLSRWNWAGDQIIHECIVPSSRPVVGYLKGHA